MEEIDDGGGTSRSSLVDFDAIFKPIFDAMGITEDDYVKVDLGSAGRVSSHEATKSGRTKCSNDTMEGSGECDY